jgi:hypothetical protein
MSSRSTLIVIVDHTNMPKQIHRNQHVFIMNIHSWIMVHKTVYSNLANEYDVTEVLKD